jgi:hypothetical protein
MDFISKLVKRQRGPNSDILNMEAAHSSETQEPPFILHRIKTQKTMFEIM